MMMRPQDSMEVGETRAQKKPARVKKIEKKGDGRRIDLRQNGKGAAGENSNSDTNSRDQGFWWFFTSQLFAPLGLNHRGQPKINRFGARHFFFYLQKT